jgi:hypothetical protein
VTVQAKLVNLSDPQKAAVGTHDRIHAGREWALFTSLICNLSTALLPTGEYSGAGRQVFRPLDPAELVDRAEQITLLAMRTSFSHQWVVETADIDELYHDKDDHPTKAGF